MTPKERAAMQQALEALEELHYSSGTVVAARMYESATAALREALAEQVHTPYCKQAPMCKTPCGNSDCVEQAEQEPVATDMERADAYLKGYTDARRDSKDKSK